MTPATPGARNAEPVEPGADPRDLVGAIVTILVVEGMGCGSCVNRVRGALLQPAGVLGVEVELERGLATVYSRGPIENSGLAEAVRRAGEASGQRYRVRRFATVRPTADARVSTPRGDEDRP